MPWKECSVVEERLRFVARLLEGEAMTDLCLEFGISRKTGYKIFDRYKEHGFAALSDRSRPLVGYANQLTGQVDSLIVSLKRNKPHAAPARSGNCAGCPAMCACPPKAPSMPSSNVTASLNEQTRARATGTPLSKAFGRNDLWCADFKGEFTLGNGRYCYPLTVTEASRFPLMREASRHCARTSPLPPSNGSLQVEVAVLQRRRNLR